MALMFANHRSLYLEPALRALYVQVLTEALLHLDHLSPFYRSIRPSGLGVRALTCLRRILPHLQISIHIELASETKSQGPLFGTERRRGLARLRTLLRALPQISVEEALDLLRCERIDGGLH